MKYSVIVPVYNRTGEVRDLLESLSRQTLKGVFEVVLVDDGSTEPCREVAASYGGELDVKYYFKENEGRSIARNHAMENATGDYFIFFDSDCVIPPGYFDVLDRELKLHPVDCFGGPDGADAATFSPMQRAINFAMTSFLTTGGIRGGKVQLERFTPRTFNMGFSRRVYERVGGFREMFSEDIDMSTRIRQAGFSIALIRPAMVWHKRRIDLRKFWRQVHVFGMSRITLKLLYPGSLKAVHTLPALAVAGFVILLVLSAVCSPWWLLPIGIYAALLFASALLRERNLRIALLALPASFVQITGYGTGFIRAYFTKILLGRGRDLQAEIEMRRGK